MLSFKLLDNYHFKLETQLTKQCKHAELEVYWFLPPQLGLDQYTYPKELFYRNLVTEQKYQGLEKSFIALEYQVKQLNNYLNNNEKSTHKLYWRKISLLTKAFENILKTELQLKKGKLDTLALNMNILQISDILKAVRNNKPIESYTRAAGTFRYFDNYISLLALQKLLALSQAISDQHTRKQPLKYGSESLNLIEEWVKKELDYRQDSQLRTYEASEQGAEKLFAKMKQLKRYLNAPTLLLSSRKQIGTLTEQIVFGFAAALSMAIATGIAFYSQQKYGNFSTPFFYALVLSYILKDRLKEISRKMLFTFLTKKFYYFSYLIKDPETKKRVAIIKDTCNFVAAKSLPSYLTAFINKSKSLRNSFNDKQALSYKRVVHLNPHSFSQKQHCITDSLTFNLSRMLRNFPNRQGEIYFQNHQKISKFISRQKYSIYLFARCKIGDKTEERCFKLSLNKKGVIDVQEQE